MIPNLQTNYLLNETIAACDALLLQHDIEQQLAMILAAERGSCGTTSAQLNKDPKPTRVVDSDSAPTNALEELPRIYSVETTSEGACGFCARRVRCCK